MLDFLGAELLYNSNSVCPHVNMSYRSWSMKKYLSVYLHFSYITSVFQSTYKTFSTLDLQDQTLKVSQFLWTEGFYFCLKVLDTKFCHLNRPFLEEHWAGAINPDLFTKNKNITGNMFILNYRYLVLHRNRVNRLD